MRIKYCGICGKNHEGTGCPSNNPLYDSAIAEIAEKNAEIKRLLEQFNPCNHTGFESFVCEKCGYPDPVKYIAALKDRIERMETTPDFARGFNAGRDAALRRNPSGCCCKFTDEREGDDIVSLCEAHKEHIDNATATLQARIKELEEELSDLKFYLNNLPAHHQMQKINQLRKGLDAVEELIDNSKGVAGLHLNGELAPWGELRTGGKFELWLLDFDSALNDTAVDECRAALKGVRG